MQVFFIMATGQMKMEIEFVLLVILSLGVFQKDA